MGLDAPAHHTQHVLRYLQGIQRHDARFIREDVPRNWTTYCDQVTDNFRVIDPTEFRIIA